MVREWREGRGLGWYRGMVGSGLRSRGVEAPFEGIEAQNSDADGARAQLVLGGLLTRVSTLAT
jgi:hypothetical protein